MEHDFVTSSTGVSIKDFLYRVFGWMGIGLAVTGAVSYLISTSPSFVIAINSNWLILMALFIAQLGLVVALGVYLQRMNFMTAMALFLLYSALTGITLSSVFIVFTQTSIFTTFIITASMFAFMSLYGYFTQADLSTMGNILLMALFGLIIMMLVNLFVQSSSFQLVISAIGVIVFALLTAYDMQKIKMIGQQLLRQGEETDKISILGALTLYLDFINLFLFLLSFTGRRKD